MRPVRWPVKSHSSLTACRRLGVLWRPGCWMLGYQSRTICAAHSQPPFNCERSLVDSCIQLLVKLFLFSTLRRLPEKKTLEKYFQYCLNSVSHVHPGSQWSHWLLSLPGWKQGCGSLCTRATGPWPVFRFQERCLWNGHLVEKGTLVNSLKQWNL